jgi:Domain of unknown function (DUF4430)
LKKLKDFAGGPVLSDEGCHAAIRPWILENQLNDNNMSTIDVTVTGGPNISVPWFSGMNAQEALEGANAVSANQLTFALEYFAGLNGYLVVMINGTYESFLSSAAPFFYWEFFLNGVPANAGIDQTLLRAGDVVGFALEMYSPTKHQNSTLQIKYSSQMKAINR